MIKAEKDVLVWKQGSVFKENFERKFSLLSKLISLKFLTVLTLCSSFRLLANLHLLSHSHDCLPVCRAYSHAVLVLALGAAIIAGTFIALFCVGLAEDT